MTPGETVVGGVGPSRPVPRIEGLRVRNFRALRDVEIKDLTPLTVFLGPNGSGKSTLFDVFAFLAECFTDGLRKAWGRRGRFRQLRTRGSDGPIVIRVRYRERPRTPLLTYSLQINERATGPVVEYETLRSRGNKDGPAFEFFRFEEGEGEIVSGDGSLAASRVVPLASPEVLAVNVLGQLASFPQVGTLRDFVTSWHLSHLSVSAPHGNPEAGAREQLSPTGDNLANVIQFLREQHPDRLDRIFDALRRRVPRLERFDYQATADGRLLLLLKDAPFEEPILARYASDGTLKLLAYLVLLYDPVPPPLIGIEEPENYLHPRLLPELAEECEAATNRAQLLVTTHSPFFIDRLRPAQVRVMFRREDGCTVVRRVADMSGIKEMMEAGASLGDLWLENHFDAGDPLGA